MTVTHPSWCIGTESPGSDHVSAAVEPLDPEYPIGVRLQLTQPEDEPAEQTRWTVLEVEFAMDGEKIGIPLDLPQARALFDGLSDVLPPIPGTGRLRADAVAAGVGARRNGLRLTSRSI